MLSSSPGSRAGGDACPVRPVCPVVGTDSRGCIIEKQPRAIAKAICEGTAVARRIRRGTLDYTFGSELFDLR